MGTVPVALFAYSRPEHLKKVLEGIRINNVPLIYVFVDGPKDYSKSEAVKNVIEIVKNVDWSEIKLNIREKNYGLAGSIRTGVTEVLEKHDRLIVLEDDIVMRPGAYKYTIEALSHYENDNRIMSISMWSDHELLTHSKLNGFLSGRFICWGWATYRKYWILYNDAPLNIYKKCLAANIDIDKWGSDIKWQAENAERKNLWYIGYALTHMMYRKLSYFPKESLTINIGRDGSGENTGGGKQDNFRLIKKPVNFRPNWPTIYDENNSKKFYKFFNPDKNKSFKETIYYLLKRWLHQ
ncbi:MAG: hypothetical protein ABSG89_07085 [Bacteroidales bacterium]|jgi:hypothetical protein